MKYESILLLQQNTDKSRLSITDNYTLSLALSLVSLNNASFDLRRIVNAKLMCCDFTH